MFHFLQNSLNHKERKKMYRNNYDIIMDLGPKRNSKNHQIKVSQFELNSLQPPFGITITVNLTPVLGCFFFTSYLPQRFNQSTMLMYGRTIEEQLIIDVHNYTTGRCKSYLTHLYVKISVFIYGMSTLDRLTCSLLPI